MHFLLSFHRLPFVVTGLLTKAILPITYPESGGGTSVWEARA